MICLTFVLPFRLSFSPSFYTSFRVFKTLNLRVLEKRRFALKKWTIQKEEKKKTKKKTKKTKKKMSFLKRVLLSSSFTSSSSFLGGGGGGGRFARRRRLTDDGSKEKKSLGVVRRSINYTNLLLVTKETALAKYASLFARDNDDAQKENVRWDRLKLRHEAHENAVAKGIYYTVCF